MTTTIGVLIFESGSLLALEPFFDFCCIPIALRKISKNVF